jgi:hypothetical protein
METWKNNRIDYGTWKNETFGVWKTQENYDEWVEMKLNEHKYGQFMTNEQSKQHEEEIKEMKKQYYLVSKERIGKGVMRRQWVKNKQQPHVCAVCGGKYTYNNKYRHVKTEKHLDALGVRESLHLRQ